MNRFLSHDINFVMEDLLEEIEIDSVSKGFYSTKSTNAKSLNQRILVDRFLVLPIIILSMLVPSFVNSFSLNLFTFAIIWLVLLTFSQSFVKYRFVQTLKSLNFSENELSINQTGSDRFSFLPIGYFIFSFSFYLLHLLSDWYPEQLFHTFVIGFIIVYLVDLHRSNQRKFDRKINESSRKFSFKQNNGVYQMLVFPSNFPLLYFHVSPQHTQVIISDYILHKFADPSLRNNYHSVINLHMILYHDRNARWNKYVNLYKSVLFPNLVALVIYITLSDEKSPMHDRPEIGFSVGIFVVFLSYLGMGKLQKTVNKRLIFQELTSYFNEFQRDSDDSDLVAITNMTRETTFDLDYNVLLSGLLARNFYAILLNSDYEKLLSRSKLFD